MIGLPLWHPVAVHFPLALVVTGSVLLAAARCRPLERHAATLAMVGTWNLCLGAVAVLPAVGSGLAAVLSLEADAAARAAVALHIKWAVCASAGVLLVAAWRGAGRAPESRPSAMFLAVLCVVTAALIVTGYHGGQNVYRHGVAVHRVP
jgi:uncharacterized membrane protein